MTRRVFQIRSTTDGKEICCAFHLNGSCFSDCSRRNTHRASGVMALLLANVDPDKIRIVGRWRSNAMFRYLHAHAEPLVQGNVRLMFSAGHYTLL